MIHIALIDSGVHAHHPHLRHVEIDGFGLDAGGRRTDYADVHGHGTAIAAAIFRHTDAGRLTAIRVLDSDLRCGHPVLARAVEEAAMAGAALINLSLGTDNPDAAGSLSDAVVAARSRGATVVAAASPGGAGWPADLPTVISALADPDCPPDWCRWVASACRQPDGLACPVPRFAAHGQARPAAGIRGPSNFLGNSLAAAHLTALVARALTENPGLELDPLARTLRERFQLTQRGAKT